MAKHDWPTIRKDYVEGIEQDGKLTWPSMEDLAEKYGIGGNDYRNRASKEGWVEQRGKFRARQVQVRQTAKVSAVGNGAAKFDLKILGIAQMMADRLTTMMAGMDEAKDPEPYRKAAAALVNVQRAGRIALGEPADGPPGPGGQLLGTVLIRVVRDGPFGETIEHNGSDSPLIGQNEG